MKTKPILHWSKDADAEGPDGRGYWHTTDGSFRISPNFRHTINPDSYTVYDYVGDLTDQTNDKGLRLRQMVSQTLPTVAHCKAWAESRVARRF